MGAAPAIEPFLSWPRDGLSLCRWLNVLAFCCVCIYFGSCLWYMVCVLAIPSVASRTRIKLVTQLHCVRVCRWYNRLLCLSKGGDHLRARLMWSSACSDTGRHAFSCTPFELLERFVTQRFKSVFRSSPAPDPLKK